MGPFDLITTSETCDNKNCKWGRMVAYQKKYVQEMNEVCFGLALKKVFEHRYQS